MPLSVKENLEGRKVEVSFRQYGGHVLVNISNGKRCVNFTRDMALALHADLGAALRDYPTAIKRSLRVIQ